MLTLIGRLVGEGTGPVHRTSNQVPVLSKLALGAQAAVQIGDGSGVGNSRSNGQTSDADSWQ